MFNSACLQEINASTVEDSTTTVVEHSHDKQDVLPAEEELDKENNHPQAISSELSEDESVPSMLGDEGSSEQHESTADASNDFQPLQSMKQTIIAQQELITMLSSLVR